MSGAGRHLGLPRWTVAVVVCLVSACAGTRKAPEREPVPRPGREKPGRAAVLKVVEPYAPQLAQSDEAIIGGTRLGAEHVGYLLYSPERRQIVRAHNADGAFIPASVSKLLTAAAALEVLPAEHRFETTLRHDGVLREGVLEGNLYVVGSGDPFLSIADLRHIAERLARTGIRRVRGKLFYDESYFPRQKEIDPRQEPESTFNPPVSPLSLELNLFQVHWRRRPGTEVLETFTIPPQDRVSFQMSPEPFPLDAKVRRWLPPEGVLTRDEVYLLSPKVDWTGTVSMPLQDPAREVGRLLVRYAQGLGVSLPPPEPGVAPRDAKVLVQHEGRPLHDLAREMLATSDNLMAELIGIAAARKLLGRPPGTLAESAHAVLDYWKRRLPHVDWSRVVFDNASGLNEDNRLTPQAVIAVLDHESKRADGSRAFSALLSAAGWNGTLKKRMTTPEVSGAVWGKTGTMDYGIGLAGELFARSERLLFVVLASDAELRRAQRQLRDQQGKTQVLEDHAEAWTLEARRVADALVLGWAGL